MDAGVKNNVLHIRQNRIQKPELQKRAVQGLLCNMHKNTGRGYTAKRVLATSVDLMHLDMPHGRSVP